MQNNPESKSEGITWISAQSLIKLRTQASQLPLDSGKIHAKQGGAYLSSFKGRGMEFDESRIYQAGDDIRNMDWRVTARTGTAHTKVFREERERPILLCLDLNPSMMFATRNKFKAVIATEIAVLIGWNSAKNNDRVGGLIFSADEHVEIKPRRGKTAVLDFIRHCTKHHSWAIASKTGNSKTVASKNNNKRDMSSAIMRLQRVTHPGSLIFMLSDFREMNEKALSHLANISRHNDVILIKITDPIETELPASGNYRLTDGIKELQLQSSSKKIKQRYKQQHEIKSQAFEKFCRQNRIHLITISTSDNAIETLQNGLGINNNKKSKARQTRRSAH